MYIHPSLLRAWTEYEGLVGMADAGSGPREERLAMVRAAFVTLLHAPVETLADVAFMLSVLLRDPNGLPMDALPPGAREALTAVLVVVEREARSQAGRQEGTC
jgi:hypothetical protein